MSERVLVIGAGIGGLCTALALAPTGRNITLLDRDGPLPSDDLEDVFNDWHRPGAGHIRQSHAFLARLRNFLLCEHPNLLTQLIELGVRELPFEGMLTEQQLATYREAPSDRELTIITSRRTTLEFAMRRYVASLPNVTVMPDVLASRLLKDVQPCGRIDVHGIAGKQGDIDVELEADVVVDASGKSGFLIEQLMKDGAKIAEESETAGILYFTRHYRLKPGQEEPPRIGSPPASGDLAFLKFGIFPGDNGRFSVTIAVPEVELEIRKAILNPELFHSITQMLPGVALWTDEDRAEGVGKVYGMGNLHSRWREMVQNEKPAVHGYLALGDTLIRTNPLYGRGCSFAAVSAQVLRRVLDESTDAHERAIQYDRQLREELRPYYDAQLRQDRAAIKRARQALTPGHVPSWRARLMKSFAEDGVTIAVRADTDLLRQAMRGFHMLEHPDKWLKKRKNFFKVLYYWARGRKRNAAAYAPTAGPSRSEMMAALSLDMEADVMRVQRESQPAV